MVNTSGVARRAAAALAIASAFAHASSLVPAARAQQRTTPTRTAPTAGRGGAAETVRGELERELMERELTEGGARERGGRDDRRQSFARMSEDFTRIQVLNNELVLAASRREELDLKSVARSAAEIRRRAQRLKTNLALPEPEKSEKRPKPEESAAAEGLKPALLALGKLIAGFAHNPVFKESGVVDAQLSARARRDLEEIIETAGWLSKSSERLDKAARKSQP